MNAQSSSPLILITGAARRVGAEITRYLHSMGCRVILHCNQSQHAAEALATELNTLRPVSASVLTGNLAHDGIPEKLAQSILDQHGSVDGLVNNASSFFPTPIGKIDHAAWDNLIGSNLKGPLFLSQALSQTLTIRKGAIVNIIDIHAERPLRHYPLYCAAKAGLAGLTRALALELGPDVRVNGIAPGAIEWPEDGQFPLVEQDTIIENSLLKRKGTPEDIARTVHFLLFNAPYITGQIIAVDGGRSIHL